MGCVSLPCCVILEDLGIIDDRGRTGGDAIYYLRRAE